MVVLGGHRRIAMRARALRAHGAPKPRLVAARHGARWLHGIHPRTSRSVRVSFPDMPSVRWDLRSTEWPDRFVDITFIGDARRGGWPGWPRMDAHEVGPARTVMRAIAWDAAFGRHGHCPWRWD